MTSLFAAAAVGSALASIAWSAGGWGLVCATGAVMPVLALLFWAAPHVEPVRRLRSAPER